MRDILPVQDCQQMYRNWKIKSARDTTVTTLWVKFTPLQRDNIAKLTPIINTVYNYYYDLLYAAINKGQTFPNLRWLLNGPARTAIYKTIKLKFNYSRWSIINEMERLFLFEIACLLDMLNKNQNPPWQDIFRSGEVMQRGIMEKRRIFAMSIPHLGKPVPSTKNYIFTRLVGWVRVVPEIPQSSGRILRSIIGFERGRPVIDLIKSTEPDIPTYKTLYVKLPKSLVDQVSEIMSPAVDMEICLNFYFRQAINHRVCKIGAYPLDTYEAYPIYISSGIRHDLIYNAMSEQERTDVNYRIVKYLYAVVTQSSKRIRVTPLGEGVLDVIGCQ